MLIEMIYLLSNGIFLIFLLSSLAIQFGVEFCRVSRPHEYYELIINPGLPPRKTESIFPRRRVMQFTHTYDAIKKVIPRTATLNTCLILQCPVKSYQLNILKFGRSVSVLISALISDSIIRWLHRRRRCHAADYECRLKKSILHVDRSCLTSLKFFCIVICVFIDILSGCARNDVPSFFPFRFTERLYAGRYLVEC